MPRLDPALTRHIGDKFPQLDALVGAAESVQAMIETAGWAVFMTLIDSEIRAIDDRLDSGRVLDSKSEYAHLHGRRGGLRAAPALLQALVDRAERDLAEQRERHEAGETAVGV